MLYARSGFVGIRVEQPMTKQEVQLRPCAALSCIDVGFATGDVVRVGQTGRAAWARGQVGHVPLAGRLVWRPVVVARLAALAGHMGQTEVKPA